MKKTEILAPAGGEEQLLAAVRCGADAVYLGTKRFNARNSASNFDETALQNAVKYCHARNVKVYVTMNTLVTDSEIPSVIEEIKMIAASGVDAVIIQDLAVAALWKKYCPSMRLHASTQMTVHNLAGAKACEELGFKRIVLARELTFSEIRTIAKNVNAEIEIFVHGALCMSVSGTCLLSSMLGARSGNRGKCAQPCRLNFRCREREYALSLKDLSLIHEAQALAEAGVVSFKIEGRMKRPEYVAAAVTAVKNAIEGTPYDMDALQAVFSRSGFTNGYYSGKRNLDMFGYRRHEDVTAAASVLKNLAVLYKDEIKKIPIDMSFTANRNFSKLTVTDGENEVSVSGEAAAEALSKPLDPPYAEKSLAKTGGTVFYPKSFHFEIENNVSIPASQINAMRREALEKLYHLRYTAIPKKIEEEHGKNIITARYAAKPSIRLYFDSFDTAFDDERADKIILPMSEILKHRESTEKFASKLICELPFLVFAEDEERFLRNLQELKTLGIKEVSADNIGTLTAAAEAGFAVHGGHGLNILNTLSASEYEKLGAADITVSPELMLQSTEKMKTNVKKGVIGYGYLPLMRFRACPVQTENGCKDCKGLTAMKDRLGTVFYVRCSDKKYSSLLNSVPLYIGDKPYKNIDFITLRFTTESREICKKIVDAFCEKRSLDIKKTGGLYFRELL